MKKVDDSRVFKVIILGVAPSILIELAFISNVPKQVNAPLLIERPATAVQQRHVVRDGKAIRTVGKTVEIVASRAAIGTLKL